MLDLWAVPFSALSAIAVAAHVSTIGPHLALLAALASASYPLLRVAQVGARRTAVRLDAEGVSFSRPWPLRVRRTTVPWSELKAVVLWGRALRRRPQYVGLSAREGARTRPDATPWRPRRRTLAAIGLYEVPPEVTYGIRVGGLRVKPDRLAAAVRQFAPHVGVVDAY